jgi:hypothetical protein
MGEICRTHGMRLTVHTKQSENLNGTDHFGDQGVDGRIILKWTLEIVCDLTMPYVKAD